MSKDPDKPPRPGRGVLKKAALAGLLITLLTAATVSAAVLLEVDELVDIVKKEGTTIPGIKNVLDNVDPSGPRTILVIGSDRRYTGATAKQPARSDTMMLVRLDPDKGATAVLSIPRDLKVDIPGHGSDKINAAYSLGGAKLTLETVKQLLDIPINNAIELDFKGFIRAVDRLGCVYTDVDHRYYHSNVGVPVGAQYAEINITPGYQKLCGGKALDYARYRHTDSDFVRSARQQDFVRQAKDQFGLSQILGDRKALTRIFARNTRTDDGLRSTRQILSFLKLGLNSSKNPVQSVKFTAYDIPGGTFLGITPQNLQLAVSQFKNARSSKGSKQTGDTSKRAEKARKRSKEKTAPGLPPGVIVDKTGGQDNAAKASLKVAMPVYYPMARIAGGQYYSGERDYPAARGYRIHDRGGDLHDAYRLVIATGENGQYYGIQGTTWKSPPILDNPTSTKMMRGRKYLLFGDGNRLRTVAWQTPRAVYWVSNTLSEKLTNKQMLAIARSLTRLGS